MSAMAATPLDVLQHARATIADPARWTKGEDARDSDGDDIDPIYEDAVCWCAVGAIQRATYDLGAEEGTRLNARRALLRAIGLAPSDAISVWNDAEDRTHAEVLQAFDRAIASLTGAS